MKPRTIDILGKQFQVKYQKPGGLDPQAAGRIVNDLQKIWIDKTNHPQRQREVLLHEIVHAFDFLGNLGIGEENTGRLAHLLFHFLRSNPDAVGWITK